MDSGEKKIEILYEDHNVIAINKPAGLLVHGHSKTEEETVVTWIKNHYPSVQTVGDDPENRPGIVHRLDKETSGVLLIAKTQEYFLYLKSLFQNHEIKKTYQAFAWGAFQKREGMIDQPIGIVSGSIRRSVRSQKMAKSAVTEYHVKKEFNVTDKVVISSLEVMPKTGRTHQIRVHLSSIGHPIVGDTLYRGVRKEMPKTRLMLHAFSLEFALTPGHRMRIEAPPPPDFQIPQN